MNSATAKEFLLPDFVRRLTLRDGTVLQIRMLRPDEQSRVRDLLARCSPESLRFRFLHPIKSLSESDLHHLTDADGTRHVALAVLHHDQLVALGQYQALEDRPAVAEVSFLVADAMQRQGIGTALLQTLAALAQQHGITRFSADVLADNQLMLAVFRHAGYALHASTSYGVTHLEFPIVQEKSLTDG
jgi:GNAT superfamily N-acetyltransferase